MAERTNLITKDNPMKFIVGSVLLLTVSGLGIFWLLQNKKETITNSNEVLKISITPTATITLIPTEIEEKNVATISGTKVSTATATPSLIVSPTASIETTVTPTVASIESFESKDDGFSVKYSSLRKLYQDTEGSGKRYTFYSYSGNIAVHVGNNWSWINPGRNFSDKQLIDGHNSAIYEISNQKLVDIDKDELKYTIQCIHNGKKALKDECEKFLEDFKFI